MGIKPKTVDTLKLEFTSRTHKKILFSEHTDIFCGNSKYHMRAGVPNIYSAKEVDL